MIRRILFLSLIVYAGCVPAYKPGTKVVTPSDRVVTPSVSFDTYKKDVAANYRQLAQNCLNGNYEYVSELVDASKKLDTVSKDKRSKPINTMVKDALGSDKLDKAKAAEVLLKIADDLDPAGKVDLVEPNKQVTLVPGNAATKLASKVCPLPTKIETRLSLRYSGDELLNQCKNNVQFWDVIGGDFRYHLYEHGYTADQIGNLSQEQCALIHSNTHAGVVQPLRK